MKTSIRVLGLFFVLLAPPALATPRLILQPREALTLVRLLEEPRPWLGPGQIVVGAAAVAAGVGIAVGGVALFFDLSEIAQNLGKLVFGWVGASLGVVVGAFILIGGAVALIIGIVNYANRARAQVDERRPAEAVVLATAPDRPAAMPTLPGLRPGSGFEVLRF